LDFMVASKVQIPICSFIIKTDDLECNLTEIPLNTSARFIHIITFQNQI